MQSDENKQINPNPVIQIKQNRSYGLVEDNSLRITRLNESRGLNFGVFFYDKNTGSPLDRYFFNDLFGWWLIMIARILRTADVRINQTLQ